MADQTQSVLNGRYALREEIARGGMAAVYLADDLRLGRQVAVKVLTPEESRQPRAVEQFRREAQAAAALSHPNVVAVYGWGCVDDTAFLVMEHVDGPDLRQLLREHGPLPEELAVRLAAQLLGALEMAHGRGIVHRDVKPRNVLIDSRGSARLADFGIAASAEDEDDAEVVYGTALYVAPELVRGQSVDGRADLYSLGVLLYEVLTGEPPFRGGSPADVAAQHVRATPVPPRQVRADLSPGLETVVLRALEKDSRRRYQTADEMRAALLGAMDSGSMAPLRLAAAPPKRIRTRPGFSRIRSRTPMVPSRFQRQQIGRLLRARPTFPRIRCRTAMVRSRPQQQRIGRPLRSRPRVPPV